MYKRKEGMAISVRNTIKCFDSQYQHFHKRKAEAKKGGERGIGHNLVCASTKQFINTTFL